MTSGELAIARATRSASSASRRLGTSIRPDPRRALAVGDDLERELEQHGVEQPVGQRPRPTRRVAWSSDGVVGAHLAVDGDPLERAGDGAAQGRLGVGDHGVGLDEAQHRREARLDHPGALGLGGDRDAAGAHACSASGRGRWS